MLRQYKVDASVGQRVSQRVKSNKWIPITSGCANNFGLPRHTLEEGVMYMIKHFDDLIPKSLLLQLEAGRNFETFIVEYFRHRAHFKH